MTIDLSLCHLGGRGSAKIPLPCFLIEHDEGLVLFDTGVAPEAWEEGGPRAVWGPVADMFPLECPPGNRLDQQIAKAGFGLDDVTHVVLSHAHLDHTGGLHLFPKAQFIAAEAELAYAYRPHPWCRDWFGVKDLERVRSSSWSLLSTDFDLFGDGSIRILHTPGHTPGHMSMLVTLGSRAFMLGADIGHTQMNLQDVPCPADLDTITAWRSIQRVKQLSASHHADIWVFHDPGDWEKFGSGPHT